MRLHFPSCIKKRWMGALIVQACLIVAISSFFLSGIWQSHAAQASTQVVSASKAQQAAQGQQNPFPYGSCTWWAAQRYHQMTGVYVPWKTGANAWQWTARAREFHWNVSSRPSRGAIIDLQPWVQGAYGAGHVAVVEKVLGNGHVIASNMSWGTNPWSVVDVQFSPGPGVTFLSV